MKRLLETTFNAVEGVEVVGHCIRGHDALRQIALLKPDLVTINLDLPDIDSIELLRCINKLHVSPISIILSGMAGTDRSRSLELLEKGAFELFIKKEQELIPQLTSFTQSLLRRRGRLARGPTKIAHPPASKKLARNYQCISIGCSTGGPFALNTFFQCLPQSVSIPILLVQHMPPKFTNTLAHSLQDICHYKVCEAEDGQVVEDRTVYIAPGGKQMKVERHLHRVCIALTDDPPIEACKPSVDYLFQSVAKAYRGSALGVILTGMGCDGAEGVKQIKAANGTIIVQDEQSSAVFGMPRSAIETQAVDYILPLHEIPKQLAVCVEESKKDARSNV